MQFNRYYVINRVAFFWDLFLVVWAYFVSSYLVSAGPFLLTSNTVAMPLFLTLLASAFILKSCRVHKQIWRFFSFQDLVVVIKSVLFSSVAVFLLQGAVQPLLKSSLFFSVAYGGCLSAFMLSSRFCVRYLYSRVARAQGEQIKVLVIGAGKGGALFLSELEQQHSKKYIPVGILDDSEHRQKKQVRGVTVIGKIDMLAEVVRTQAVDMVIVAIPSLPTGRLREVLNYCEVAKVPVRSLPCLEDITSGKLKVTELKAVSLEDLLGRDSVELDTDGMAQFLAGKVVLVTGGGGSIGSEICRQCLSLGAISRLVVVDNSEYALYQAGLSLEGQSGVPIALELVSITDNPLMDKLMDKHRPDIIFHAAAYKHVPLLETQPEKAIFNNIVGTKALIELANTYCVSHFIFISTDKAVNPTSIMGASKRFSELLCLGLNQTSKTNYSAVRFGNVLGSAGSVIPLFKKQLAAGGPLTVTHPDIERYFMTIPEACQLVLASAKMSEGGEVFVLDMGKPAKIKDLAEELIKLSGKRPYEDVDIHYTGLRLGEKLYEELFYSFEVLEVTEQSKVRRANYRDSWPYEELNNVVKKLLHAVYNEPSGGLGATLMSLLSPCCSDGYSLIQGEDMVLLSEVLSEVQ